MNDFIPNSIKLPQVPILNEFMDTNTKFPQNANLIAEIIKNGLKIKEKLS